MDLSAVDMPNLLCYFLVWFCNYMLYYVLQSRLMGRVYTCNVFPSKLFTIKQHDKSCLCHTSGIFLFAQILQSFGVHFVNIPTLIKLLSI